MGRRTRATESAPATLAEHIGHRLRELRKNRGLTLQDVSDETGISLSHLSHAERAHNGLGAATLWKLSQAFGVRMDYWFRGYKGE